MQSQENVGIWLGQKPDEQNGLGSLSSPPFAILSFFDYRSHSEASGGRLHLAAPSQDVPCLENTHPLLCLACSLASLGVNPSLLVRAGVHPEIRACLFWGPCPGGRESQAWPWPKPPAQGDLGVQGMSLPLLLPRFLLSKLLQWNIIAFHFIFKNCCQGSLLASWSQHKSEKLTPKE